MLLPLYFSIAHAHGLYLAFMETKQWSILKTEIIIAIFKVFYTQVFGIYSGWVYWRTWFICNQNHCQYKTFGNLWVPIVLHA